ncbi:MAG: isoleucine--tRNA ligase [Patescibacteria group bacterium]|nr:isoleucine--tRNA ligase [Patescibacteria group bacterium]
MVKKFKLVDSHPNFVELEEKLLKSWDKNNIVKKYLKKNSKSKKKFTFLDGPITANNPMGVHHGRGRTYKDLWQRYYTMRGYKQRYQNGFDCQGLWVEVEVEKDLRFKNKKDIEKYGVDKFVKKCKSRVEKYATIQTEQSKRLGMWMDWDKSYFTMSDKNNYTIWNFLKICHQRGWLYKGHDSVPWCPRCQTAISQHEMLTEDYKEVSHKAIFFTLPIVNQEKEYLLVWTTTPWTLPANIAVAVEKTFDYSLVKVKSGYKYWLLKSLVKKVLGDDVVKILKTVKGSKLIGLKYHTAFDSLPAVDKIAHQNPSNFHLVIATDKLIMPISKDEGTGLVHTAVSAGTEDYKLGKKLRLPLIPVIKDNAEYFKGFGSLSNKNAKKHPELIFNYLKKSKNHWIYKIHHYTHRYPACWRCKTELVWKVTDEWYINMDKKDPTDPKGQTLRQQMISTTKKVNWIPGFGLDRELDWLKNMNDWLISKKNRYWGLCLPIYECKKCQTYQVIGSKEELKEKAVEGWDEFKNHSPHKPFLDKVKIKCENCGQVISRIEPVGNPWLDAGIVPFSTLPKDWFPADFITEAFPGQFKNWFYSMLVMSTVLKKTNPFKTVLGYESVVGEDGRAMHKSWGNSIEFNSGAKRIGVDVMRWMYAQTPPTSVLPFGYKKGDEIRRLFILILWNSYRFFITQSNLNNWSPDGKNSSAKIKSTHILDKWILSRLENTTIKVTKSLDKFYSAPATLALEKFVNDFSTWYIRRSRDRTNAYQTMYHCLIVLTKLLAPFMPYISDIIYKNLTGKNSVHLTDWPKADKSLIHLTLEENMKKAREVVEKIHAQRKQKELKVRQPLAKVTIIGKSFGKSNLHQVILDETNIKNLEFTGENKDLQVILDTKLTPVLKAEGQARELIRQIQKLRKKKGTDLDQEIEVELPNWPKDFEAYIKEKALIKTLTLGQELKIK